MKKLTLTASSKGRIIKIISDNTDGVKYSAIVAAIRKKDVLLNGVRVNQNVCVEEGDSLVVFLPDNAFKTDFSIFYEDENVIIVNKGKGIEVCNGDYNVISSLESRGITAFPVHRIDRNTSGLCMFAKSHTMLDAFIAALREKRIRKFYKAEVFGMPPSRNGVFVDFMIKDAKKAAVKVFDKPLLGAEKTETYYKVVRSDGIKSLLEVQISGGFTHQIRASVAYHGCPIVGDGKYGDNKLNRESGFKYQRLCAYKLVFDFAPTSPLAYLNAKIVQLPDKDIKL